VNNPGGKEAFLQELEKKKWENERTKRKNELHLYVKVTIGRKKGVN